MNNANIKEAKIINIDVMKSTWYCGSGTGLGISFSTPNFADGEANTRAMVDFNATLSTPYTASNAAFMSGLRPILIKVSLAGICQL